MNFKQYIPLQLLIWLIFGIGLAALFPSGLRINWYIIIANLILLTLLLILTPKSLNHTAIYVTLFAIIFSSLGYLRVNLSNPKLDPKHYSHFEKLENELKLTLTEAKKEKSTVANFVAKISSINGVKAKGKIRLSIKKDSAEESLVVGAQFKLTTLLTSIKPPLNPYEFNYQEYLKKQGIFHQIFTTKGALIPLENSSKFTHWAAIFRKKISERLAANGFQRESLAMINALILGQRNELSPELIENYQNAGAIHILAVSGLHVGIILLLFNFLLHPLLNFSFGKPIKLVLIITGLWMYALLAGSSPSVIRAATMFTAVAIGLNYQNRINTIQALVLSLFFLLLIRPSYIFEVGFQLSYVAVLFIVWIQPLIEKLWRPRQKVLRYSWQLLSVSGAAQLGVLPLSLYYFHQFPGLFFLSNLVVIPLLGTLIIVGVLIILLALINYLPTFMVAAYSHVIDMLNTVVAWIGQQDSFVFEQLSFSIYAVILGYMTLVSLLTWVQKRHPKWLITGLIGLCCFQLNFLYSCYGKTKNQWIVFNTYKETLVAFHMGSHVSGFASDPTSDRNKNLATSYAIGAYATYHQLARLKNTYQLGENLLTIIDKNAIIPTAYVTNGIVLLSHSPAINLERLILNTHPIQIIADGSNYPSDVIIWEKTCKSHNIKFHYTVRDGAFLQQL